MLNPEKIQLIQDGHQHGMLDHELAKHAKISISSVKRYRNMLGLKTNCETTKRGVEGEQLVAFLAQEQGFHVTWPGLHNEAYDLQINGLRVDCKASMQRSDGGWNFSLPSVRPSFYGNYRYPKNYAADCEILALICFRTDGEEPDIYFLRSADASGHVRIRRNCFAEFKNAWTVFEEFNAEIPSIIA
jgi:hypothetical protein